MHIITTSPNSLISRLIYVVIMTSSLTQTTSTNSSRGSSGVYLYVSRIDSVIEPSQLTLECKTSSDDVVFWRQVEGQAERLTFPPDAVPSKTIYFTVTPDREGEYYCTGGGVRSDPPSVEVVAYPIPDKTIKLTKSLTVPLGSDVTIPCVFVRGALHDRYTIQWFKGLTEVDFSDPRFDVTADFSLVIENVNALDANSAYYCVIDIASRAPLLSRYHNMGPSIQLIVTGALVITDPPQDTLHLPSSPYSPQTASYTCNAHGQPPPFIVWLHQGTKVTSADNQVYSLTSNATTAQSGTTVVSELDINGLQESQSGPVECLVVQHSEAGGEMTVLTSTATLTVLPSSFTPTLIPTSDGVELSFSLPALLPTSFSLIIHYYDTSNDIVSKSELVDPTFANSREVDYVISSDELPLVETFFSRVSVKIDDMEGGLSQRSNVITVSVTTSTATSDGQCSCRDDQTTADSNPEDSGMVQTILIAFVVLLAVLLMVAVGVAVWGILMMIRRMKKAVSKGSLTDRSYTHSRSSYRSRSRSRSYSRSRSHSTSPSRSKRSYKSNSVSRCNTPCNCEECMASEERGVAMTPGAPEGRGSDGYLTLQSAVPAGVGSQTGSADSGRQHSTVVRPLPSVPYQQLPSSPQSIPLDPENKYEELKFKKRRQRRVGTGRGEGEEGERGGEGERAGHDEWVVIDEGDSALVLEPIHRLEPGQEVATIV